MSSEPGLIKSDVRFRLTAFDPNNDVYTANEWLDELTKEVYANFWDFLVSSDVSSKILTMKTVPLTPLLRKDNEFNWTGSHEKINQEIIAITTAKSDRPDKNVELHTEAYSLGIKTMFL
ncbi:hypothetical protein ABEB36_009148 [Hypothenemus hampei]|uniref:Uncharacterized protein n=1 Tax=Hypothenemus hampei TaxID=57062 RepID=A0ABD1EPA7_HYPHA